MRLFLAIPLAFFLAGCPKPIKVNPPPPPDDRFICEPLPERPDISPLEAFEASNGAMVYLKADVDARDAGIASYVVDLRGAWFSCQSALQWVKDYYEGQ